MNFRQVQILRSIHVESKTQEEDVPKDLNGQAGVDHYLSHVVHSSDRPLCVLQRVALSALPEDTFASSKYVIVRVLERGVQAFGWGSVVEDEFGNGCFLNVYNYPQQELFCPETVLIIKEPYLKKTARQFPLIRCDCPTDIIVLRRSHPYSWLLKDINWVSEPSKMNRYEDMVYNPIVERTAAQSAALGESLARDGFVNWATECYLSGLKQRPILRQHWKRLIYDLCEAFLSLGCYETTVEVLKKIPQSKIVKFSAGQAYYHLRKYDQAEKLFKEVRDVYPDDVSISSWMRQTKRRLKEEKAVTYPIEDVFISCRHTVSNRLDHADHVGPVKVDWNGPNCRSVIVTKDVAADTLLIVSKAFAVSFSCERRIEEVLSEAVQAVAKNPETFGPMIYSLSIDWQPEQVIPAYCDMVTKAEPFCDVERIKGICRAKTIAIPNARVEVGAGLFVMPSYMKHSCQPNVYALFFGDIMIVYSDMALKAKSEVFYNYTGIPTDSPYEKRKEALNKRGLECKCTKCQLEI